LGANHWWLGKPWINHVDDYELSYDACFKADKEFAAQVLRAIDLAFLQLFDSCFRAATIIDIDFSETRLSNLREDILGNHFQANKPAYLITSNKKTRDQDDDDADEIAKKRRRFKDSKENKEKKFRDLGDMVKNQ